MRKHSALGRCGLLFLCVSSYAWALTSAPNKSQDDYERSIQAVVRHKEFYKSGRIEVTGTGGVMPYDSLINHYMLGGRLTWHLSDNFGWEIIDGQVTFPTITGYTQSLVSDKGISNLQTQRLHLLLSTNLLISPLYGKIRLLGRQIQHFDIYTVVGVGLARNDTVQESTTGLGQPTLETNLRTGFDPMFDFGLGFKFFLNHATGLVLDLRDYVVYSQLYGSKTLKGNFSVFVGLSFFLPTFYKGTEALFELCHENILSSVAGLVVRLSVHFQQPL